MDLEINSLQSLISIGGAVMASTGFYLGMKYGIQKNTNDIKELKEGRKEAKDHIYSKIKEENDTLNSKIKDLAKEVKDNREKSETGLQDLKDEIHKMAIDIIQEIHNISLNKNI